MKTCLDCVPCIIRQALETPRRFTDDAAVQEKILRRTLEEVARFESFPTPPEMGGALNRIVAEELGVEDPFLENKRLFNRLALEQLPGLRRMIGSAADQFGAAVRLAATANVIDFGAPAGRTDEGLEGLFEDALERSVRGEAEIGRLAEAVRSAREILYLADNAGEIVVDRLLLEQLPRGRVTVAVRSGPAINDALVEDAETAGIPEVARLMESGVALPGTPLRLCSPAFRERFRAADLIISKGQGNFETLSHEDAPITFLLVAKCGPVADQLGCDLGELVVVRR